MRLHAFWSALAVAGLLSTSAPAMDEGYPEPSPLGRDLPSVAGAPADPAKPAPAGADLAGSITLRDALAAALLHNPTLSVQAWEVRAREARILQASLRPNPEASLEVEDLGFSGDFAGVNESQATLRLGQLVELGGKRQARMESAALERDLAGWDYESARLDVLTRTTQAFVGVVGAQETARVHDETVQIAAAVVAAAEARSKAGVAPEVEVTRARVALSEAGLDRERARLELDHARHFLSSLWGESNAGFERAEGRLDSALALPPDEALLPLLDGSPDLARWKTEQESRRAALALQRSRAIPDVTFIAGLRRLFGPDGTTFVGEVAVPLPLWNRNQGSIAEAQHRIARAGAERRVAELTARTSFIEAYETLRGLLDQAHGLETAVLPGLDAALGQLRQGYEQGRFGQLELLTAERARATARSQHVRLLTEFHQGVAALERVLGAPIDSAR